MTDFYEVPSAEDINSNERLVGSRITVYWDGDDAFYPCRVMSYDKMQDRYIVLYENDPSQVRYPEDLKKSTWKLWKGSDEDYMKMLAEQAAAKGMEVMAVPDPNNPDASKGKTSSAKKSKIPTYSAMVLEAVVNLNEREGSSLQAIRKYIMQHYDIRQAQTASFHNLTLKAVNKAVALNELEKFKHSFRLSQAEKDRRKEAEKRALQALQRSLMPPKISQSASKADSRKEASSSKESGGVSLSRKMTPFVIDHLSLSAVAQAHNKSLRKELLDFRNKRDKFLKKRLHLLRPFLPEKDYFTRRELEEAQRKAEKKAAKKAQEESAATTATNAQDENLVSSINASGDVPMNIDQPEDAQHDQLDKSLEDGLVQDVDESDIANISGIGDSFLQGLVEDDNADEICEAPVELDISMEMQENGQDGSNNHNNSFNALPSADISVDQSANDTPSKKRKAEGLSVVPDTTSVEVPTTSSKKKPLPVQPEDDEEIDETKLFYSTLEGVVNIEKPSILQADLHDHQVTGISWMVHMFKNGMPMILGDQMGLGKTLQTIGFLSYLHEKMNKKGPYLIVVPLSVLSNWMSEIERFCPSFRAVRFHGPKSERDRIKEEEMSDLKEFDVVVTTFEILVSEVNFFRRKYVWTSVVVDEGHRLKNDKSQLSEKLRCVPCISKVLLTGTPLQNNLHELWALLFYLAPDIFTSSEPFDQGFDLVRGVIDNVVLRRARKMLSVFMLRRVKEQVDIKLPSRKEVTLLVNLTTQQVDLYKQILCGLDASTIEVVMREGAKDVTKSAIAVGENGSSSAAAGDAEDGESSTALVPTMSVKSTKSSKEEGGGNDSDWRKLMNILLQLRKICNHTYLLPHVAPESQETSEDIVTGSGKLLMLDRMLPPLRADGHRVLIFSQFTSMLDILEEYCELREYPFVRLDGETNRVKRRLDVRRFNAPNSPLFIFLISTRAGGLGLNLASADTVILYDSDWNPQVDLQAMERVHRIGQTKPVRVFRLVCRGSVEERMISRAEKKLFLNAMVAEIDPDEQLNEHGQKAGGEIMEALGVGGGTMSKAELASLIRFGANAVFDSASSSANENQSVSDEELYQLLERDGRDKTLEPIITAEAVKNAEDESVFEKAQQQIKERMESLQEVDLRQLGNMVFTKKKTDRKSVGAGNNAAVNALLTGNETASSLIISEKRQSKKRIVMIDGKGTGYGGAVPVLASSMEPEVVDNGDDEEPAYKARGRQWVHRHFCTLCGKVDLEDCENQESKSVAPVPALAAPTPGSSKKSSKVPAASPPPAAPTPVAQTPSSSNFTKCAHCPFTFHTVCGEKVNLFGSKGSSGMYICPHHRCVDCNRSTASAGGLLFRCSGCLTAYCEDCLPQDEIDSVGRCKPLELFGYNSKQAYYIKCPTCCAIEGFKPLGVLGDQPAEPSTPAAHKTVTVKDEADGESEEPGVDSAVTTSDAITTDEANNKLKSVIRIQWDEILPPPPPPPPEEKSTKSKKGSKKRKTQDDEEDEEEETFKTPSKKSKNSSSKSSSKKGSKSVIYETSDDEEEEDEEEIGESTSGKFTPAKSKKGGAPTPSKSAKKKQEEIEEPPKPIVNHPKVSAGCSLSKGLTLVSNHESLKELLSMIAADSIDINQEFAVIVAKIEAGRYRSSNLYINDVKYIIEGKILKKVLSTLSNDKTLKEKANTLVGNISYFLKELLEPKLEL